MTIITNCCIQCGFTHVSGKKIQRHSRIFSLSSCKGVRLGGIDPQLCKKVFNCYTIHTFSKSISIYPNLLSKLPQKTIPIQISKITGHLSLLSFITRFCIGSETLRNSQVRFTYIKQKALKTKIITKGKSSLDANIPESNQLHNSARTLTTTNHDYFTQ